MVAAGRQSKQMGLPTIEGNHVVTTVKRHRRTIGPGLVIGGHWRITTDELNVVIAQYVGGRWRPEAYVTTLAAAFTWLVNHHVRGSEMSDLKDTVARIEQLKRDIIGIAAG
jgi:hypothetical protein